RVPRRQARLLPSLQRSAQEVVVVVSKRRKEDAKRSGDDDAARRTRARRSGRPPPWAPPEPPDVANARAPAHNTPVISSIESRRFRMFRDQRTVTLAGQEGSSAIEAKMVCWQGAPPSRVVAPATEHRDRRQPSFTPRP